MRKASSLTNKSWLICLAEVFGRWIDGWVRVGVDSVGGAGPLPRPKSSVRSPDARVLGGPGRQGICDMHQRASWCLSLRRALSVAALSVAALSNGLAFGDDLPSPALGDVDTVLSALTVGPDLGSGAITMRGRNARQQLFVTGVYPSGRMRDFTHTVTYRAVPDDVVMVDASGLVTPLRDGATTVRAALADGPTAEIGLRVEGLAADRPVNFKQQVIPVFTKLGCSGGGCHGKASGQNGFRLSLLGFYPDDDYEFLVKESRGRRLFPASPEESLILQKALGNSHGGGQRLQVDSYEYRLICQWIEQAMPYGGSDDPTLVAIRCLPDARVLDRHAEQQVTTTAFYSDGTTEDVTRMAVYESNDSDMAEVTIHGLVSTRDRVGEVAVMARYQGQVATFRATIPLGADTSTMPPPRNLIDEAVFGQLKRLGIPSSLLCDDATFVRRVYIDVAGMLPTAPEVEAFLTDTNPAKRDRLIEQLLDGQAYADLFANKWSMVLRNKKRSSDELSASLAFYRWIWSSLYENKPYDRFVREILTAAGNADTHPAVTWYREVDEPNEQVEDVAQLFLGLRIQCAKCHHHPYEVWSQDDYYGMSAYFSRVGKKFVPLAPATVRDRRVYHADGTASAANPRTGANLPPAALGTGTSAIPVERDPRVYLADWLTAPDNPFFARALVNRYWKHFFGRGIVEPEDDMRATNPPSNPELLDRLAAQFVASGYDLKALVRTICQSQTYQLSAVPNAFNTQDKQCFSRHYPKRLPAEVLVDAFQQVTDTVPVYPGWPAGTRSMQVADRDVASYFLTVYGQPQANTACECERLQDANLAQSLHLLNNAEVLASISNPTGRAARLASAKDRSPNDRVRELYLWVYSREPDSDELQIAHEYLTRHETSPETAYGDLMWALLNTREFLFNN